MPFSFRFTPTELHKAGCDLLQEGELGMAIGSQDFWCSLSPSLHMLTSRSLRPAEQSADVDDLALGGVVEELCAAGQAEALPVAGVAGRQPESCDVCRDQAACAD